MKIMARGEGRFESRTGNNKMAQVQELLRQAGELHRGGMYRESMHMLKQAEYTRDSCLTSNKLLAIRNNTLVCQMKMEGSRDLLHLQSINEEYKNLWQQVHTLASLSKPNSANAIVIKSFIPCHYNIKTDLAIAGNYIASSLKMWLEYGHHIDVQYYTNLCTIAVQRVMKSHIKSSVEECSDCSNGTVSVNLAKLKLFQKLLQENITKPKSNELKNHSDPEGPTPNGVKGNQPQKEDQLPSIAYTLYEDVDPPSIDSLYSKAYQLYHDDQVMESLCVLQDTIYHPKMDYNKDAMACVRLLAGNCLSKLKKHQLALHHYLQCLDSTVTCVPAMINSSILYQDDKNIDAELKMRYLVIHILRQGCGALKHSESRFLWYWRESGFSPTSWTISFCRDKGWMLASYELAVRSVVCGKYTEATKILNTLVNDKGNEQLLSPLFPSFSLINLLYCQALSCSNEYEKSEEVSSNIIEIYSMPTRHKSMDAHQTAVTIALATWYSSLAALHCHQDQAYELLKACLQTCTHALNTLEVPDNTTLYRLREMVLTNMAVLAAVQGRLNEGIQLLASAIGTNQLGQGNTRLILYNYCLLLAKAGKLREACTYWLKELEMEPKSLYNAKTLSDNCLASNALTKDEKTLTVALLQHWMKFNT